MRLDAKIVHDAGQLLGSGEDQIRSLLETGDLASRRASDLAEGLEAMRRPWAPLDEVVRHSSTALAHLAADGHEWQGSPAREVVSRASMHLITLTGGTPASELLRGSDVVAGETAARVRAHSPALTPVAAARVLSAPLRAAAGACEQAATEDRELILAFAGRLAGHVTSDPSSFPGRWAEVTAAVKAGQTLAPVPGLMLTAVAAARYTERSRSSRVKDRTTMVDLAKLVDLPGLDLLRRRRSRDMATATEAGFAGDPHWPVAPSAAAGLFAVGDVMNQRPAGTAARMASGFDASHPSVWQLTTARDEEHRLRRPSTFVRSRPQPTFMNFGPGATSAAARSLRLDQASR